ncbi:two-component system response regulator [Flavobacterium sp. AG291]|uniref:response regulator n=1 Tax=Flavobacterium sp. AG291 TaxID=2184000 RepID=UPI000E0C1691|nr:response regulator [Flavobacterium sp. AG291]
MLSFDEISTIQTVTSEMIFRVMALLSPNIECITFLNGKQALEYLKTAQTLPEMIFTDINMYLMDGKEFISRLIEDERTKKIPTYAYTTPFMFSHLEPDIKNLFSGQIFKMVNFSDFEFNLRKIIKRNHI